MPEYARDVAHCRLRHHGAEGTDLRNVVAAVLVARIADDFIATVVGVVHVDVGSRRTFRVEETFKGKVVFERVYVGNAEHVGCKGSRNRTTNSGKNAALARLPAQGATPGAGRF